MININELSFETAGQAAKYFKLNRVYLYQIIKKYGKNLNYFPERPQYLRRWELK
jgi:hypothetical protein